MVVRFAKEMNFVTLVASTKDRDVNEAISRAQSTRSFQDKVYRIKLTLQDRANILPIGPLIQTTKISILHHSFETIEFGKAY